MLTTAQLFPLSGYVTAGLCITSDGVDDEMGVYWACRFWIALRLDWGYVSLNVLVPHD